MKATLFSFSFTLLGFVLILSQLVATAYSQDLATTCNGGCTETVEYWKNNLNEWEAQWSNEICGQTWLDVMSDPSEAAELFQLFIASSLNIQLRQACTTTEIETALNDVLMIIDDCDQEAEEYGARVRLERYTVIEVLFILRDFNSGVKGPGPCPASCECPKSWRHWKANTESLEERTLCGVSWYDWLHRHRLRRLRHCLKRYKQFAREYVAAKLNIENGACAPEIVEDALGRADGIVESQCLCSDRRNAQHLFRILRRFNWGLLDENCPADTSSHEDTSNTSSKDRWSKENSKTDHSNENYSSGDHSSKDYSSRGHSSRDHSSRDHSSRDHSSRDHSSRDHSSKEGSKQQSSKEND